MQYSYVVKRFGWVLIYGLANFLGGCTQANEGASRAISPTGGTTTTTGPGIASIEIAQPSLSTLFTKDASSNKCVAITAVVHSNSGGGLEGVQISFAASGDGDTGTIDPASGTTDAEGTLTAQFCSGTKEGNASITAKSSSIISNSVALKIINQPIGKLKNLAIGNPTDIEFYTKEATEKTCGNFYLLALDETDKPIEGLKPAFSLKGGWMTDPGKVSLLAEATDSEGKIYFTYCTGESEGTVIIQARASGFLASSKELIVKRKPVYIIKYLHADIDPTAAASGAKADSDTLDLNVRDSGPKDCINLTFKLTVSGTPLIGKTVEFVSQPDFPKGSKLAQKAVTNPMTKPFPYPLPNPPPAVTNRTVAYSSSTTKTTGEVDVPVCAGNVLGTLLVTAIYTDSEGNIHRDDSPVIRINSGTANYNNMTLTYDPVNGRSLRAYYTTNSSYALNFKVQLGSRQDGSVVTENPIFVATEAGKIDIDNAGYADSTNNTVGFKVHALHLTDNYPYQILRMPNYPLAQTRCDVQSLSNWVHDPSGNNDTPLRYRTLARNWRLTMIYGTRGQEGYNDANRDGLYTEGGDGFWDKNQDGFFDDSSDTNHDGMYDAFTDHIDGYTYPTGFAPSFLSDGKYKNETTKDKSTYASTPGSFNRQGEWFIDLPAPFVDVDEDGLCNNKIDLLPSSDTCSDPNGKRDADTVVWKHEVLPVSMGASPFSLRNWRILPPGADGRYQYDKAKLAYGNLGYDLPIFGTEAITLSKLRTTSGANSLPFDLGASENAGYYHSLIFLHDVCGNLLPGGTEITVNIDNEIIPNYGKRSPYASFYTQPFDDTLEATRRLVLGTDQSNKVLVNFNAVEHPSSASSYPLLLSFTFPSCISSCSGALADLSNPGVSCGGYSADYRVTIKEPKMDDSGETKTIIEVPISLNSVDKCNCAQYAYSMGGVCTCPEGLKYANGVCAP